MAGMARDHRFASSGRRRLLLKKQIEGTFTKNLWVIATMMIVVGLLLALAEWVGKREHGMTQLGSEMHSQLD